MSFDAMKVDELVKVAESFAVDLDEKTKNAKGEHDAQLIIAALAEEGVTYDEYVKFVNPPKPLEPEVEVEVTTKKVKVKPITPTSEKNLLVKMVRPNQRFDICGKTFTKDHPFVLCTEAEAQEIFDREQGFHIATPREAQEYYS